MATPNEYVDKIAQLLERNGISLEDVDRISRISVYQNITKNEDGSTDTHDLFGVQITPSWQDGPKWPVVQPGPAIKILPPKADVVRTGWPCAVVLPDMQIGYYTDEHGVMQPTHDENALAVALAVLKAAKPTHVVMVGDNLDLPEFGKYRLTPAFQRTAQAAIDRATMLCAQIRQAAPDAEVVWIEGNHEARLTNYILDNGAAAFGLRQGNKPEAYPVLSVPFLCQFDQSGVTYLPGYPASSYWLTERLRIIHGDRVASGGSTAHKYLSTEKTSVIYGHIHRVEYAERTREDHDGPKTIMAASPGCLARIDGAVPSTKGGHDLDGRPIVRHEDWQQGLAVIPYNPDNGMFVYEHIAIRNGWAMWRGKEYSAKK